MRRTLQALQMRGRRMLLPYTVLLFAAMLCLPAQATSVDEVAGALKNDQRIYDFARVMSQEDKRAIRGPLEALESKGLAEGAVILLDRLEGGTVEEYALQIGERWKVGRKDVGNGFVLVASIGDRKWWIEVGRDLQGTLTDATIARLGRENLVPAFRERRYGQGVTALLTAMHQRLEQAGGVEALPVDPSRARTSSPSNPYAPLALLLGVLTAASAFFAWPRGSVPGRDNSRIVSIALGFGAAALAFLGAAQPGSSSAVLLVGVAPAAYALFRLFESSFVPVPMERLQPLSDQVKMYGWVAIALGALAGIVFLQSGWTAGFLLTAVPIAMALAGYFRRVPRKCPECAGPLRWLLETEEPEVLHEEENVEQRLGSRDYDVWQCQKCSRSAIFARDLPAPYTECPRCHRRTMTHRSVMVEQPTAFRDGVASDISECQNPDCGHRDEKSRTIGRGGFGGWGGGGGSWDDRGFSIPPVIIIPPIFGGGWGGGHHGDSGGWSGGDSGGWTGGDSGGWGDGGGVDLGGFGGGGDFDGGGGGGDW